MGWRALSWAWPLADITPVQKFVLVALADSASDAGECWPGYERLIEMTCLSERAIRDALRALSQRTPPLIEITQRTRRDGGTTSPSYRLCMPPPAAGAGGGRQQAPGGAAAGAGGGGSRCRGGAAAGAAPTREGARARGSVSSLNQTAEPQSASASAGQSGKLRAAADEPTAYADGDLTLPASLTPAQRAAVVRQLRSAALDVDAAQTVLDVLAHRLALARDHGTGTPPEPVSYTRGLLRRLAAGTLDDTDALPIRAARAAAERAERAAAASAASTAPAAPAPERTQPPEDLRAQLRAAARGRKS